MIDCYWINICEQIRRAKFIYFILKQKNFMGIVIIFLKSVNKTMNFPFHISFIDDHLKVNKESHVPMKLYYKNKLIKH